MRKLLLIVLSVLMLTLAACNPGDTQIDFETASPTAEQTKTPTMPPQTDMVEENNMTAADLTGYIVGRYGLASLEPYDEEAVSVLRGLESVAVTQLSAYRAIDNNGPWELVVLKLNSLDDTSRAVSVLQERANLLAHEHGYDEEQVKAIEAMTAICSTEASKFVMLYIGHNVADIIDDYCTFTTTGELPSTPDQIVLDMYKFYDFIEGNFDNPAMDLVDTEFAMSFYPGLEDIELAQCYIYMPMISATAGEVALVECANEADVERVVIIFQNRIKSQIEGGAFYPATVEAWETSAICAAQGRCVMLYCGIAPEEIAEAFQLFAS